MPRMNEAFPGKYLKADSDVPEDEDLIVTFAGVELETLGQGSNAEQKYVAYFRETDKGLVLNKTNWGLIAKATGSDDSDDWTGRRIALYSADVQFGQEMKRGIRVRSRSPKSRRDEDEDLPPSRPQRQAAPAGRGQQAEDDESIPF